MGQAEWADARRFVYRIDDDDRITHVNDAWLAFARENGMPEADIAAVPGRVLWDFLSDTQTAEIYRQLLADVRRHGTTHAVNFRCDSPEMLRLMTLEIAPHENGEIQLSSHVRELEQRPRMAILDPEVPRSDALLTLCSWCKRMRLDDAWVELGEGVTRLGVLEQDAPPQLTHGICEDCSTKLLAPEPPTPVRRLIPSTRTQVKRPPRRPPLRRSSPHRD